MRSFVASATAFAIFAVGCGSSTEPVVVCTLDAPPAVSLRFSDAQSGQFIGAGMRVSSTLVGSASAPVVVNPAANDSSRVYIFGVPGTYEITSDKPGYSKRTDRITVPVGDAACNKPKTVDTTLALTKSTTQ